MDIVITIPKKVKWEDYQKELDVVKDGSQMMLYHIPLKPKENINRKRCYLCYDGYVRGWMRIIDVRCSLQFLCSTHDTLWPEGWYVCRSGEFHKITPVPMKGFRGYRYIQEGTFEDK